MIVINDPVRAVPDLPPLDPDRLDAYAGRFTDRFARADQFRWFRLYLRGLLDGGDRKNAEAIAARVGDGSADFAQALQHFVSHSPWDADRVVARYRELLPASARGGPGTFVVHDGVIEKKGRHSVGTQRQFARPLGRKVNCQVAVVVGRHGPGGYVPLGVRLYLPAYWLRESPDAVEKTVPATARVHRTKAAIADELLAGVRAEGWSADRTAADGPLAAEAQTRFEWLKLALGLDHFEGRTWAGWHHHTALVLAGYGFLQNTPDDHH